MIRSTFSIYNDRSGAIEAARCPSIEAAVTLIVFKPLTRHGGAFVGNGSGRVLRPRAQSRSDVFFRRRGFSDKEA